MKQRSVHNVMKFDCGDRGRGQYELRSHSTFEAMPSEGRGCHSKSSEETRIGGISARSVALCDRREGAIGQQILPLAAVTAIIAES